MSWSDYNLKCIGYLESEQQKIRGEWERTRWQTLYFINTQIKRPIRDPKKLIRFAWEKVSGSDFMTNEQFDKLRNKWRK